MRSYVSLLQFDRPIVTTAEAATLLKIGKVGAIRLLQRLAKRGLIVRLKRGLWGFVDRINSYEILPYLTAPYPSYISLWTALHEHGMIDQVPRIIYAVSLGRPRLIKTPIGVYSVHRLSPRLFGGFNDRGAVSMAGPEKSLFDTVYILVVRTNRTVRLPEMELPEGFDDEKIEFWLSRIPSARLRTRARREFTRVLSGLGLRTSVRP